MLSDRRFGVLENIIFVKDTPGSSLLCAAAGVTKVSGICHEAISTTIALMVQQPIMGETPS
jgi:hypothetical protein